MAADEKAPVADIIVVGKIVDDSKPIWDKDPLHPSNYGEPAGEIFISDMRPYRVNRNRSIQQKLGEQAIRELSESQVRERTQNYEDAQAEREAQRAEMAEKASAAAVFVPPAQATVPTSPPPSPSASSADGDEDDEDAADDAPPPSGQTSGATLPRPRGAARRTTATGSTETPPER